MVQNCRGRKGFFGPGSTLNPSYLLVSLFQGSKSRKISYRAIVHDFVHGQNIFRARFVHDSCTKKIVQKIEIVRKSCYLKCNITLKYWVKGMIIVALIKQLHQMEPFRTFYVTFIHHLRSPVAIFGKKMDRISFQS